MLSLDSHKPGTGTIKKSAAILAAISAMSADISAQVPNGVPLIPIGSNAYRAGNTILIKTGVPGQMRDTLGNTYKADGLEIHQNPISGTKTTYQVPISGIPTQYYHWTQLTYAPLLGRELSHEYANYTSFRVEQIHMYSMHNDTIGRPTISYADKLKASNPGIYKKDTDDVPTDPKKSYMTGSHTGYMAGSHANYVTGGTIDPTTGSHTPQIISFPISGISSKEGE